MPRLLAEESEMKIASRYVRRAKVPGVRSRALGKSSLIGLVNHGEELLRSSQRTPGARTGQKELTVVTQQRLGPTMIHAYPPPTARLIRTTVSKYGPTCMLHRRLDACLAFKVNFRRHNEHSLLWRGMGGRRRVTSSQDSHERQLQLIASALRERERIGVMENGVYCEIESG